MSVTILLALGLAVANATPLERCRAADADFDYERVITDCSVASAEPGLVAKERTEVFRLLGIAHTAQGNDDVAQEWFIRLLSIDPAHKLPPEVSPVYRTAFEKAKTRFDDEGKVSVTHVAAEKRDVAKGRFALRFELTDKFVRAKKAFIVVTVTEGGESESKPDARVMRSRTPLVEGERLETGARVLTGEVLDPSITGEPPLSGPYVLEYNLELQDDSGAPVTLDPPMVPGRYALTRDVASEDDGGMGWGVPATAGGAAAVAVLLVVGAGAITAGVCLFTPVCRPQEQPESNVGQVRIGVSQ